MKNSHPIWIVIWLSLALLLMGCLGLTQQMVRTETKDAASFNPIVLVTDTQALPTLTPTLTGIPSAAPTLEPLGCQKPPDDYTRVEVNGWILNQRTLAMLAHAQELYGGEQEIIGYAITQGSYTEGVSASFGTHSGGGAVDLSILRRDTYTVLWDDVEPLLRALRIAGFAAWLRESDELYAGSPIHIHAIAIGDQELSVAAEEQLTGAAGYFRGYSGLPFAAGGVPTPDRYGGPIFCQWMIDLGYRDLR
jgi:hypothetical protein